MRTASLLFTTFLTGAVMMATEMTAARLVAPWFGATFLVWAALLGVVLLAVAAGGVAGGARAERCPGLAAILPLCLGAGLWLACVPGASAPLCSALVTSLGLTGSLGAALALGLLVAPPVALLAMVPAGAVRALAARPTAAGSAAGRVAAASTLGGVVGTSLPGLVLLPALGTRATVWCLAGGLVAWAILGRGLLGLLRRGVPPAAREARGA